MTPILPGATALRRFSPSVIVLVLANMIPVAGVFLWDWSVLEVMLVFWAENVVIGLVHVLKILTVVTMGKKYSGIVLAPFFIFHYGLFTLVHGAFIFALFGDGTHFHMAAMNDSDMEHMRNLFLPGGLLFLPALGLFASHFMSYVENFIHRREYADPQNLIFQPYGRVMVLHVVTLFGGAMVEFFGAPILALLLLIVLKIVFDIGAHVREHDAIRRKGYSFS